MDGLGCRGPWATWGTGLGASPSQVAAGCIEKDPVSGGQRCAGSKAVHAVLVDVGARLRSGAQRFFAPEPALCSASAHGREADSDPHGRASALAQLLERGIGWLREDRPHEGEPSGIQLGRVATAMRLGHHVFRKAITLEQVADTAQTEPKAGSSVAQRTLLVLIGLHHSDTPILAQ
jgi:hypothetical protein